MKAKVRNSLIYIGIVIFFFLFAACGHSGKKKVEVKVPQDTAWVVEEESVVIQVDTLVPDSTGK